MHGSNFFFLDIDSDIRRYQVPIQADPMSAFTIFPNLKPVYLTAWNSKPFWTVRVTSGPIPDPLNPSGDTDPAYEISASLVRVDERGWQSV